MTPGCLSANASDEKHKVSATAPIPRISIIPPSMPECIPRGTKGPDSFLLRKLNSKAERAITNYRRKFLAIEGILKKVPGRNRSARGAAGQTAPTIFPHDQ